MSRPHVSVVIPTRSRDAHLRQAIGSVLEQGAVEMEIIVVDNAPSESTRALCAEYPVTYLRQEQSGASAARNLGVSHSRGELIAFLDDDDLWPAGSLEWRLQRWGNVSRDTLLVGRARRFKEAVDGTMHFLDSEEESRHLLLLGASLIGRDTFLQCGGFDESIRCHEDTDLWIRLKSSGVKISYLPEICLYYRRHGGNVTAAREQYDSHLTGVLRRHLSRVRSLRSEAHSGDVCPDDH